MKISTASESSSSRPLKGFNSNFLGAALSGEKKTNKEDMDNYLSVLRLRPAERKVLDAVQLAVAKG